jgi:hypothetical protein
MIVIAIVYSNRRRHMGERELTFLLYRGNQLLRQIEIEVMGDTTLKKAKPAF